MQQGSALASPPSSPILRSTAAAAAAAAAVPVVPTNLSSSPSGTANLTPGLSPSLGPTRPLFHTRTSSTHSSRSRTHRLSFHDAGIDPKAFAANYVDPDLYPPEIPAGPSSPSESSSHYDHRRAGSGASGNASVGALAGGGPSGSGSGEGEMAPMSPNLTGSSSSLRGMSKQEMKEREELINRFEAEEEWIMNKLSKRLDELKQHSINISQSMEAESEAIVNRLQRQLQVVEAQLAAVRSPRPQDATCVDLASPAANANVNVNDLNPDRTTLSPAFAGASLIGAGPGMGAAGMAMAAGGGTAMGDRSRTVQSIDREGQDLTPPAMAAGPSIRTEAETLRSPSIGHHTQFPQPRTQPQIQAENQNQAQAGIGAPSGIASNLSALPQSVGLQTFLTGTDPLMMGSMVHQLRNERADMQHQMDAMVAENDAMRQELIALRQRLGIPVDELVGLRPSATYPGALSSPNQPTTQPISFVRRPVAAQNFTSSASTSASTDGDEPFPASMGPSSQMTTATSPGGLSLYSYDAPVPPYNTAFSVGSITGRLHAAAGVGRGGMPLTYPSVPPPSLATSLASTSGITSPTTSPINSRRPSFRVAERGSLARPPVALEEETIEE